MRQPSFDVGVWPDTEVACQGLKAVRILLCETHIHAHGKLIRGSVYF